MKYGVLILVFISLLACATARMSLRPENAKIIEWRPEIILSQTDAERILGEAGHLDETVAYSEGITKVYSSQFSSNTHDQVSGKTGTIYYMFEEYPDAELAHRMYQSIFTSNEKAAGVRVVPSVADQAYFHSDGQNFLFALVRKDNHLIRIKVNKTTSHTDEAAFHELYKSFWK